MVTVVTQNETHPPFCVLKINWIFLGRSHSRFLIRFCLIRSIKYSREPFCHLKTILYNWSINCDCLDVLGDLQMTLNMISSQWHHRNNHPSHGVGRGGIEKSNTRKAWISLRCFVMAMMIYSLYKLEAVIENEIYLTLYPPKMTS